MYGRMSAGGFVPARRGTGSRRRLLGRRLDDMDVDPAGMLDQPLGDGAEQELPPAADAPDLPTMIWVTLLARA